MTATDWRQHATPEAQQAFADAQARLDEGDYPDGEAGHVLRQCDEALTDRYDRLVLQPAHDEFERRRDEGEFNGHFPEPADDSRIEWEGDGGTLYAAFRQDLPEHEDGSWFVYGSDHRWSWRALVWEYQIDMADLTLLVPKENPS